LRSDWLTQGPAVTTFENALLEYVGAKNAIACSSGTAALHAAYLAAGIGPGDVVIVPAITFLATASMVRMTGADVVFADVSPDSGLMEIEHAVKALDKAKREKLGTVKAVAPVHLGGQVYDPPAFAKFASDNDLIVIEDACHAIGTRYYDDDGAKYFVGQCAHSSMAAFSFHPVKTIVTGEGGAITTNDPEIAQKCRQMICHGMTRDSDMFLDNERACDDQGKVNPWYYEMQALATNYRASDIHCALGLSQLKRLDTFAAKRCELTMHYRQRFDQLDSTISAVQAKAPEDACWHLSIAMIDFSKAGISRADVMSGLLEHGIRTQVHYIPVSDQPYYRGLYGKPDLPGASSYYDRCLSLPLFPDMTIDDVDYVVDHLSDILGIKH
jgi:UDP-4-amino-4,6-dideoxy-N-acetyl-beta-L-altrosamine transaminase